MRGFLTMYVTKDYLLELIKEVEENTGVKLTNGQERRLLKDVKAQWENYGEELLEWLREYICDSVSDSK